MPLLPGRDGRNRARHDPLAPSAPRLDRALARHRLRRLATRSFWRARFAVAAVCCGLAAALVVGALRPAPPPTVTVLVAAHAVPAGTTLDAHDVRLAHVAAVLAPAAAYRTVSAATGRLASVALDAGTVVSPSLVAAGSVAARAPRGRVVVALSLGDDPATALLGPGDHVDLLASAADDEAGPDREPAEDGRAADAEPRATSSYLAHGALVLPSPPGPRSSGGGILGGDDTATQDTTLVVAVTPHEAESIAGRPDWARVTAVLVR